MVNDVSPTATQSAKQLLVVDDERSLRFAIGEWARDLGFQPFEARSGGEACDRVREHRIDVVLLDLKLGDEDGMAVLQRLRAEAPHVPVIMLTGHGGIDQAVEATRLGAFHFVTKPPDLQQLESLLAAALENARLRRELEHLRSGQQRGRELIGESPGLRRVLAKLGRVAPANHTVLIRGETGVGKELMARYVHAQSPRAGGPFIELNCSAIPEQLLESELFGHERGAFTDAKQFRAGLFELADGGTLFLDEIGDMASHLQAKLLRVLEARTFRRVGGNADVAVDVRVVAATHRDLNQMIRDGRFREDLYFRLNVVPIEMPPLRERPDDVRLLVEHFVARTCAELGRPVARVHPQALERLMRHRWPGNVRELRNLVDNVLLLEADDEIRPEHLPADIGGAAPAERPSARVDPFPPGEVRPLADVERLAIEHALRESGGVKAVAARRLGISRQTLRTKVKEYALPDADDEGADPASDAG
jgi:DNA-binding NtrC family response regulator